MLTTTHDFVWRFGGWLADQPSEIGWGVLVAGALLGIGFVGWSYQTALVSLPLGRRLVLTAMRAVLWMVLLLILAAPTRVERSYQSHRPKPLAVLVDRSGSMVATDNRHRRRIDDALARWREAEPAARASFSEIEAFVFGNNLQPIKSPEAETSIGSDQTKLFGSLQDVLAQAPPGGWGGVLTLTDGLDTVAKDLTREVEKTSRAALETGTPLYFIAGHNRYAGSRFFTLREFTVPAQVAPLSSLKVEATFETYEQTARVFDVHLTVNGVARPPEKVGVEAGRRLITWSTEGQATAPGVIEFELQAEGERARASVEVAPLATNRILYFQGALDWGYRFLIDILKRDGSFAVTPVFAIPNPKAVLPTGALRELPSAASGLQGYDIVILTNVVASQISAAQQIALSAWVRDGGVLLFVMPDDDSTQGLSGSELEKMLPVIFAPPQANPATEASRLQELFRLRAAGATQGTEPLHLLGYAWETSPHVKEIFSIAGDKAGQLTTPLFAGYAHVARAKPGAEVLARHPTAVSKETGEKAILLALQRYGRGQSGVLTTDSLWRWKLNQPTSERGAELFWQNLFAWLTKERGGRIAFDHPPLHGEVAHEVMFRLRGAKSDQTIQTVATLGDQSETLTEGQPDGTTRVLSWRPKTEGFWQITATAPDGHTAKHWLSVKATATQDSEHAGTATDDELLRQLAVRTGGTVLSNGAPSAWQKPQSGGELLAERRQLEWHRPWVLGVILAIYGAEMLLRRRWRLL